MLYTTSKLFDLGLSNNDINCLYTLSNRYLQLSSKASVQIKISDLVTFAAPLAITDCWVQLFNSLSEEAVSIIICSSSNKVMETLDLDIVVDIFDLGDHVIITLKE